MPTRVFFQHEHIFSESIHILVLKVSSLGKDILFQQKSVLVPFHFINHSKLYNDKSVLQDIKIKVK